EIRPKYRADEKGINTMLPESIYLREGYIVNKQGFRSKYNFTTTYIDSLKQLGKVIMFVGDSHTEGMWAEPIDSSFVDLIDQREDAFSLNFGISGTDPLQYKLIVEKYLENLNPDLLVIPFCINNDFIDLDRKPKPFKPLWVHTNFSSLSNILPKTHPEYQFDTYFNNWEEVKSFYLHYYTLYGENINFFEKYIVDASNIFKLIYHLPISYKKRVNYSNAIKIDDKIKEKNISIKHIRAIKRMTDDLSIPFLLVGVPSLNDLNKNIDKINQNYKAIFEDVNILIPTHFEKYDYASNDNDHFNNVGHKKFADYINQRVDSIFQMR
ncbi:MAG: SGNH/GDSL hydrolase family protein, partial [Bacteroidetes bacterium]|nr:SGNH/GDSL hydrolase family protein [Bacteroidota bacterium]